MLKKIFIKYVIGECRHICIICKYKNMCDSCYEEQTWKQLLADYKRIKSVKNNLRKGDN